LIQRISINSIVQDIGKLIENLNEEMNITVVLVEQKLPFARKLGSNFVVLDRGCLAAKGRMDKLTEDTVKTYLTV